MTAIILFIIWITVLPLVIRICVDIHRIRKELEK